jgi:hypothetical protein
LPRKLASLRAVGVTLSLDDFGTGYSSLSYLKRFRFDVLKIDRSFVAGLPDNPDDVSLVKAILAMARGLDLKVVAEGVETQGQLRFLAIQGCDLAQGYLLARPMSHEAYSNYLKPQTGVEPLRLPATRKRALDGRSSRRPESCNARHPLRGRKMGTQSMWCWKARMAAGRPAVLVDRDGRSGARPPCHGRAPDHGDFSAEQGYRKPPRCTRRWRTISASAWAEKSSWSPPRTSIPSGLA